MKKSMVKGVVRKRVLRVCMVFALAFSIAHLPVLSAFAVEEVDEVEEPLLEEVVTEAPEAVAVQAEEPAAQSIEEEPEIATFAVEIPGAISGEMTSRQIMDVAQANGGVVNLTGDVAIYKNGSTSLTKKNKYKDYLNVDAPLVINLNGYTLRSADYGTYWLDGLTTIYTTIRVSSGGQLSVNGPGTVAAGPESGICVGSGRNDVSLVVDNCTIESGSKGSVDVVSNLNKAQVSHVLSSIIPEKPATCEQDGVKAYQTCSGCDNTYINGVESTDLVIPATGHAVSTIDALAPTCEGAGIKAHQKCDTCGALFINDAKVESVAIDPAGHKTNAYAEVSATCEATGVKAHDTCTVCNKTFINGVEDANLTIPAAGHNLASIDGVPATCEATGVAAHQKCGTCGKLFIGGEEVANVVIPAAGHTLVTVEGVAATCELSGVLAHQECSVCGKLFAEGAVIDSAVLYATGHTYISVPVKPATYDAEGVLAHDECTACGKLFLEGGVVFAEDLVIAKLVRPVPQVQPTQQNANANNQPAPAPAPVAAPVVAATGQGEGNAANTAEEAANAETVTIEDNETPLARRSGRVTIEDEQVPLSNGEEVNEFNWIPILIGAVALIAGLFLFFVIRFRKREEA